MAKVFLSLFVALYCIVSPVAASLLFATHYSGTVSTLSLKKHGSSYSLTKSASMTSCGAMPSWLTLDKKFGYLYCSDESATPNGTLWAYSVSKSGKLTKVANVKTIAGGVNSVIFGTKSKHYLAIAHYEGSAVSTFALPLNSTSVAQDIFTYTLPHPGPNPSRQDVPHPHQVILDPSKSFILSPDLGADVVRVYSIQDRKSGRIAECSPLNATPGSGPRHAAFSRVGKKKNATTQMYLASELANNVTSFNVEYLGGKCLGFHEVQKSYSYPGSPPPDSFVAEIRVSGDYFYVSNRNASSFGTNIDSLASFQYSGATGKFQFQGLSPTFGYYPRTFVINKAGTMVAVGDEESGTVVIVERDLRTGELGCELASVMVGPEGSDGQGGLSSVIWYE